MSNLRLYFNTFIAILILIIIPNRYANSLRIFDLGGMSSWWFYSPSNKSFAKPMLSKGVPGDIYADLRPFLGYNSPLFDQNDIKLRWIAAEKWSYERSFKFLWDPRKDAVLLHLNGLDTVAQVYINGNLLVSSSNQFIYHVLNVENYLFQEAGEMNSIRVEFDSPTKFSVVASLNYEVVNSHSVPPDCPNSIQNGECHVNFLRKIQSSFSWDWGPAFPTIGIWQPIFLEIFHTITILEFSPVVHFGDGIFTINAFLKISCTSRKLGVNLLIVRLRIERLSLNKSYTFSNVKCPQSKTSEHAFELKLNVPAGVNLQRWFPHGYGSQTLYNITVTVFFSDDTIMEKTKKIGFRTVELVQDLVDETDDSKGRTFYFKVNGIPMFLKGSNWIPISMFPARNHSARLQFLFHSMIEANFNALRVWGGGRYESNEFYALADEYGILIWQDLMFACSLYPTNNEFLASVEVEIRQQIYRLRNHPSILAYASNNENELSIASEWYFEYGYDYDAMVRDYLALYRDVSKKLVQKIDSTRPFLLSSPSNGVHSDNKAKEGKISEDPNNPRYGDIHFYDYVNDLWNSEIYEIPRCATEFGVQSFPLADTIRAWIPPNEFWYGSETMTSRQHHPGGVAILLHMASQHFDIGNGPMFGNDTIFMDKMIFYTQVHQAIALQTQVEHYRRWRTAISKNGLGTTMCAIYWQLNDVWAAPSWSSIDFNLAWKPAHYFARRFFAQLIFSLFLSDQSKTLNIYVVSDLVQPLQDVRVTLSVYVLGSGSFEPIYLDTRTVNVVAPLTAMPINFTPNLRKLLRMVVLPKNILARDVSINDLLFRVDAELMNKSTNLKIFPAVLLPNYISRCETRDSTSVCVDATVTIKSVKRITDFDYDLQLVAENGVVPIVWVEFRAKEPTSNVDGKMEVDEERNRISYYFSDNAFAMVEKQRRIRLHIIYVDRTWSQPLRITIANFTVTTISSI